MFKCWEVFGNMLPCMGLLAKYRMLSKSVMNISPSNIRFFQNLPPPGSQEEVILSYEPVIRQESKSLSSSTLSMWVWLRNVNKALYFVWELHNVNEPEHSGKKKSHKGHSELY